MKSWRRRGRITAAIAIAVALAVFLARHALVRLGIEAGVSAATGLEIRFADQRLGRDGATFRGLRIRRGGDPLFDAAAVDLRYTLRDLLPGGRVRFGLERVLVTAPHLTLVRHEDGRWNVAGLASAGGSGSGTSGPPWHFTARLRDGVVQIVDRAPSMPDLASQTFDGISLDATVDSAARSTGTMRAVIAARRSAAAPLERWPLTVRSVVDGPRGIALHELSAKALPLREIVGMFVHSHAFRLDDGVIDALNVRASALDDHGYRLVGGGGFRDGRMTIAGFAIPLRAARGKMTLIDDGLWTSGLDAMLGNVPVHARGGIFSLAHPTFRLGVTGRGDLRALRGAFAFSQHYDVAGSTNIEAVIEGALGDPLVHIIASADGVRYADVPIERVRADLDYFESSLTVDGARARVGAADLTLGGRFLFGEHVDTELALAANGSGAALPYVQTVAPAARVDALALITGDPAYRARGTVAASGSSTSGVGFFSVDERGVGEFGPFAFTGPRGTSLAGAFRLDRPSSSSAAWLSVRGFRIVAPGTIAGIPGIHLPILAPIGGIFDGDLAGGGTPSAFSVAGAIRGRDVRYAQIDLGDARARVGGTLNDIRLGDVAIDGRLGRFNGSGAYAGGVFALRGDYDGTLEALAPLSGDLHAHGTVRGPVVATIAAGSIVVQSNGASLGDANVRGVAVERAAGTIEVGGNGVRVVAAQASIGGAPAAAIDAGGALLLSAPNVPVGAIAGTGVPLDRGRVSIFGLADLRGTPSFNGTILVANGRTHGYRVAGDADIAFNGRQARIAGATAALGTTFGGVAGTISGIGATALGYDLDATVPLGDSATLARDLGLPVRHLEGSFSAALRIRGAGNAPRAAGRISVREGSYNGLAFHDLQSRVALDPQGLAAHGLTVTVGTTHARVDAGIAGRAFNLDVSAPAVDLDDFNDYFDESDPFDGVGRIAFSLRSDGTTLVTSGDAALQGLRFRRFPLGDTNARWLTNGGTIRATVDAHGAHGAGNAAVAIVPAAGDLIASFRGARYDGTASLSAVDLGTWLPAAGITAPVLGMLDARATVAGRYPNLAIGLDARVPNAQVDRYAVHDAMLRATAAQGRVTIAAASAALDFASFTGSGSAGFTASAPLDLDIRGTTPDVGRVAHELFPSTRSFDLAGTLQTDVRVTGSFDRPRVDAGFDAANARYFGLTIPRAIGEIEVSGRSVQLRDAEVIFQKGQAFVAGSLPLEIDPFAIGPATAPLSFDVTARAIDLAQFAPLFPAHTHVTGTIDGRFGVEGSVAQPQLLGTLSLAKGSYVSDLERAPIANVNAKATFAGTSVALETFHADVGGGTLDGSGKIDLPFGTVPHGDYAVTLRAKAARLDFPAYGSGKADGTLRLSSAGNRPLLAGAIALSDTTIPFSALSRPGGSGPAPPPVLDPSLEIHADAGKNVRVRSAIIDIGATGSVDIAGTLSAPTLDGAFTSTGGTFSTYNHAFRVQQATVRFDPTDGIVPTISLRAVAHVTNPDPDQTRNIAGSADITVAVTGPADPNNLQIAYSSSPPYSQAQIVGLLLDVPAILGAVNFNGSNPTTILRGAPGESNVLLPPGVSVEQTGTLSFNKEVFSLLNGQFTQRALSPLERFLQQVFGFSDVGLTVDYGGGIGYSVRRQIGKKDFYAALSQTLSYPERTNFGLEFRPDPFTVANFSYYRQNGVTSLISTDIPGYESFLGQRRLTGLQPLGDRAGVSLTVTRRYP